MVEKRHPKEVAEGIENVTRKLRIKSGEKIAKDFTRDVLKKWKSMEADLFGWMSEVAIGRDEKPPSLAAIRRAENKGLTVDKKKKFLPPDELAALVRLRRVLTTREVAALRALFDGYAPDVTDLFDTYLKLSFQDGLDYAYEQMKKKAGRQDRARFSEVAATYIMNPESRFVRAFLQDALDLVTDKISVQFKVEAINTILDGLSENQNWRTIGTAVRKKVGMGAKWHWERLVRSEMTHAYYHSMQERATDAGITYEQLSIARNACPVCVAAKGIYLLGEGPALGLHPNCRCHYIFFYRLPKGKTSLPAFA